MKRQIILAGFIFLAVAVIGLGIYYFRLNPRAGNPQVQTKEIGQSAAPQVNKLNCEDIIDAKEKAGCLAGIVKLLNSDNGSVCGNLADEADKNACHQSFTVKQAAMSGDLKKCGVAYDPAAVACAAQASFSLAIQKKDKKYCNSITNKSDKANCLKVLAGLGVK